MKLGPLTFVDTGSVTLGDLHAAAETPAPTPRTLPTTLAAVALRLPARLTTPAEIVQAGQVLAEAQLSEAEMDVCLAETPGDRLAVKIHAASCMTPPSTVAPPKGMHPSEARTLKDLGFSLGTAYSEIEVDETLARQPYGVADIQRRLMAKVLLSQHGLLKG